MASRQRRARARAALSTALARSQNKRPWYALLMVFACFSGHADAKLWYYNQSPWVPEYGKVYASADEYCAAMKLPQQSFTYDPAQELCHFFEAWNGNDPVEMGYIEAGVVDCQDPNSTPKIEPWVKPSCPCNAGYQLRSGQCTESSPPEPPTDHKCDAGLFSGNPILPATAEKFRAETDWTDSGPAALGMVRFYRSNWGSSGRPGAPTGLGQAWSHNHAVQLQLGVTSQTVAIIGPEGHQRTFSKASSSAVWTADNSADSLSATPSGWTYKRADDDTLLTFDSSGRLHTKTGRSGFVTTYGHDGLGRLATVSNGLGRTLSLGYDGAGRLSTVSTTV